MELDDATRDELAGFLARRFPTADARERLARAAGLSAGGGDTDALVAWRALLAGADRGGALARLLEAARAAAPDDRNLAEASALLARPPTASRAAVVASVAALGAVALTLVFVLARGGLSSGAPEAAKRAEVAAVAAPSGASEAPPARAALAPTEVAAATARIEGAAQGAVPAEVPPDMPPEPAAAEPAPAPAPPAPTPAAPAPPAPTPPAPTPPAPPPATVASATPAPAAPASAVPAGCKGAPGTIFGWWYAGTTSPGAAGATIELPSSVNVRADYPRKENHYAMKGQVLCSLSAGTAQRLSHAPVDIGQGHWWVPVAGGDL